MTQLFIAALGTVTSMFAMAGEASFPEMITLTKLKPVHGLCLTEVLRPYQTLEGVESEHRAQAIGRMTRFLSALPSREGPPIIKNLAVRSQGASQRKLQLLASEVQGVLEHLKQPKRDGITAISASLRGEEQVGDFFREWARILAREHLDRSSPFVVNALATCVAGHLLPTCLAFVTGLAMIPEVAAAVSVGQSVGSAAKIARDQVVYRQFRAMREFLADMPNQLRAKNLPQEQWAYASWNTWAERRSIDLALGREVALPGEGYDDTFRAGFFGDLINTKPILWALWKFNGSKLDPELHALVKRNFQRHFMGFDVLLTSGREDPELTVVARFADTKPKPRRPKRSLKQKLQEWLDSVTAPGPEPVPLRVPLTR